MAEFTATIKRINPWGNKKGEFVTFEDQPGTFWKWGLSMANPGDKMRCVTVLQALGTSGDNQRLTEFENLSDTAQSTLPKQKSALPEVARALGSKVAGGIESLPAETSKTDYDACLLAQANAIKELRKALGIAQARIDELDTKVSQVEALARNAGQV